jgi:hypothetical protein
MDTKALDTVRRPLIAPDPIWHPAPPMAATNELKKGLKNFKRALENF